MSTGDESYIPKTIPYDDCRKFYDCEKHPQECPYYKEYVESTPAVAKQIGVSTAERADSSANEQVKQLQQLAVCIEKFETQGTKTPQNASKYQQAAFLLSTLWKPDETITISFMDIPSNYPGEQPQWDGKTLRPPSSVAVPKSSQNAVSCSNPLDCRSAGDGFTCVDGQCVLDTMPLWYTRDLVFTNMKPGFTLSAEDEDLEKRVRAMDPIEAIKAIVMERLAPLMGLRFEFVPSEGTIRIGLDNRKGSWSMVGTQCRQVPMNEATMNFGWLDVATIIHEFCHALGMIHEHQNPFGKGIDWNLKKVFAWTSATQGWDMYTTCQNIIKRYNVDLVNGSDYDPESIMLYSYPATLTNNKQATYRNVTLSPYDRLWLSSIYPKDGKPRSFPSRSDLAKSEAAVGEGDRKKKYIMYSGITLAGVLTLGALGYVGYTFLRGKKRRKSRK